jgi:tripartite-type tricarboxylate transporter receptor subunit TctC
MMRAFIAGLLACVALAARADDPPFPQRGPIEITVLFAAGSSADVTARMLAEGMAKQLGQQVLVMNRPGAGGAIGYKHVAAQKPDGYSLVWNSNSISTTHHSGQLDLDYRAFDAVARVLVESPVLAVRANAPWKTLGDFVTDARARPGAVSVGHSGVGSHTHIALVALEQAAGMRLNEIPFGATQVVPSLLGGHVDAVLQLPAALAGQVKQGNVRLLAALALAEDPTLPGVPTAREQGIDAALEAWRGIAVPHGTPRPVVATLESAIRRTVEAPEFVKASEGLGVRVAFLPAEQFDVLIARDDARLAGTMRAMGLAH